MTDDQLTLSSARTPVMRRVAAMVAPVAADAGAVVDDEALLEVAREVCELLAREDAAGGLTKSDIAARLNGSCPPDVLESRLNLFIRMELLRPVIEKKHQQRYVLAPPGLVGVLVMERFRDHGGVDELLHLLDSTQALLERQEATAAVVAAALDRAKAMFAVYANELGRLVANATLDELLEERRAHDHSGWVRRAQILNRLVSDQFPELDSAAYRVVVEAQRYITTVENLVRRVLDEGGESVRFDVLDAEDYLTAALTATVDELAGVTADTPFDPGRPWVDAGEVLDALESYRPRRVTRERPPEPVGKAEADPLGRIEAEAAETIRRRALQAEQHLQGAEAVDLTAALRGTGWPAAAKLLSGLLALDAEASQLYSVEIGDAALVDREGPVTYASPVTLRASRTPEVPSPDEAVLEAERV